MVSHSNTDMIKEEVARKRIVYRNINKNKNEDGKNRNPTNRWNDHDHNYKYHRRALY